MTEYKVRLNHTDLDILEIQGNIFLVLEDMNTINIELQD